jgi:hypothetical protein
VEALELVAERSSLNVMKAPMLPIYNVVIDHEDDDGGT